MPHSAISSSLIVKLVYLASGKVFPVLGDVCRVYLLLKFRCKFKPFERGWLTMRLSRLGQRCMTKDRCRGIGAERRELCGRKCCDVRGVAREKFWRKERRKNRLCNLKITFKLQGFLRKTRAKTAPKIMYKAAQKHQKLWTKRIREVCQDVAPKNFFKTYIFLR